LGRNPKFNFNSHSTPITRFRGFRKALSSATHALLLTMNAFQSALACGWLPERDIARNRNWHEPPESLQATDSKTTSVKSATLETASSVKRRPNHLTLSTTAP
jgi:hypothetical protein